MIGKSRLKIIADYLLKQSKADETEIVLTASDFGLTRFANNQIHQNLVRSSLRVAVRVILAKKIGIAKTNKLDRISLDQTLKKAIELAKNQKPDRAYQSLPKPKKYPQLKAFFDSTASFPPKQRARKVKNVIKLAKSAKLKAFGALSTGVIEHLIANSNGLLAYFPETEADFRTTIMGVDSSGYGSCLNLDIAKLRTSFETQKAIGLALKGKRPRRIKPGDYQVVLAPEAANQMLIYLAYWGFGARAYHEDRSFVSGKLGKKVMGENITIWDDALDPRGIPMPFDLEGSLKKKVVLIEKGVAKNIVYDSYLAGKYQGENTGHGLPAPNTLDALATHLHLAPQNSHTSGVHIGRHLRGVRKIWGEDELGLMGGVKKGLYVSRFWYVNAHHHKTLTITGLTRDGTFMIENGKISYPVVNLRFTQSIPEALSRVTGIGKDVKVMESWLGANLAPALRIEKFKFTGISNLLDET
jgi:PmbA protein